MGAFRDCSNYEKGMSRIVFDAMRPVLEERNLRISCIGRADNMTRGSVDISLQSVLGDFTVHADKDGMMVTAYHVDLKVERVSSPNLFFETCSNGVMDPDLYKPGWGRTLKADRIWYCFEDTMILANICLGSLRRWLDERIQDPRPGRTRMVTRASTLQAREQVKHDQMNVTRGLLVPFRSLVEHGGIVLSAGRIVDGCFQQMSREDFLLVAVRPETMEREMAA